MSDDFDLLAEMDNENKPADDDEALDLLSDMTNDPGVAWRPAENEDHPKGIQGRVAQKVEYAKGTFEDPATGEYPQIPTVILETSDGSVWRILGFHKVLRLEIDRAELAKGDFAAFKYFGTKPSKKGKDTYVYKVASRKGK